ncbi:HAAS signaling domain-containing protein [Kordiimonas laminariae]|uniref:HAAS signaling domain-containing protein n=1 Tax=Kordiimonas laminariae TaxID=2917717 RepID=UPI001FF411B2|nr:hypothetical protein [Kordiimonas laminariae]MCK0068521.1 hypothetical protein [Kordiimonas laminariae]
MMSDRELIHEYLKSLGRYLSRLDKATADEVIREIESHIYDRLEEQGAEVTVSDILDDFGNPRDLASAYVDHIVDGAPPPKGFKAIEAVKKGVGKSLYYGTAVFGYLVAAALVLLGLAKPFLADSIGVWTAPHGEAFVVGMISNQPPGTAELLGWWLVPIALVLGAVIGRLTGKLLSILKRQM